MDPAMVRIIVHSMFRGNPVSGVKRYKFDIFHLYRLALLYGLKTEDGIVQAILTSSRWYFSS
jgi:hypothetical protein